MKDFWQTPLGKVLVGLQQLTPQFAQNSQGRPPQEVVNEAGQYYTQNPLMMVGDMRAVGSPLLNQLYKAQQSVNLPLERQVTSQIRQQAWLEQMAKLISQLKPGPR